MRRAGLASTRRRPVSPALRGTINTWVLAMLQTQVRAFAAALCLSVVVTGASAQAASAPASHSELPLFAVEIKVGPKWDQAKPAQEQAFFKEHSANLRRMRESGVLIMGARYSDKGLVIVAAATVAEVRAQMDQDSSVSAGTFAYEVHPFNVFYSGELKSRSRR